MRVKDLGFEKIDYGKEDWQEKQRKNYDILEEQDKKSKKNKTLIGRYVKEGVADGYALYLIISETKNNTVAIEHITPICGDYYHQYFGVGRKIDKKYAADNISQRDELDKIFGRTEAQKDE